MQWGLAEHQYYAASFLELHIRGSHNQFIIESVRNSGEGLYRARRNQHAVHLKRSTCDRGADVLETMHHGGKTLDLLDGEVSFFSDGPTGGR